MRFPLIDSKRSAMVLESTSFASLTRGGNFPSAKLCCTKKHPNVHENYTITPVAAPGWGGAYTSFRCLLIAANQSYTESSTMLWPMPFNAHDTLHSWSGSIPGRITTQTKKVGSSHNSPSAYISSTAFIIITIIKNNETNTHTNTKLHTLIVYLHTPTTTGNNLQ